MGLWNLRWLKSDLQSWPHETIFSYCHKTSFMSSHGCWWHTPLKKKYVLFGISCGTNETQLFDFCSCSSSVYFFPQWIWRGGTLLLLLLSCFSRVWVFATPWTVACQAPLPLGFSRQEYWSGLPFASPEDLPHPRIKPSTPALQVDSFLLNHKPILWS